MAQVVFPKRTQPAGGKQQTAGGLFDTTQKNY
jgi:hypothetical protein